MKKSAIIATAAFALAGFSSAQACNYKNKTMTLIDKDMPKVSQEQTPVKTDELEKLLVDVKKPVSTAN